MELKFKNSKTQDDLAEVLIVPYGIEMFDSDFRKLCVIVLIVPYGIEIVYSSA